MRVLVSFHKSHYSYGEAVARALEHLRPRLEVSVARSEALAEEVYRLRPDVVISDRPRDLANNLAKPARSQNRQNGFPE